MELTKKNREDLIFSYPYLLPRNVWTDEKVEGYDYEYIRGERELPEGWFPLFLQMCDDISYPLIEAEYLNKFRFSQIKEKYNSMRCYTFGAPKKVHDIIQKYEVMSSYVCTKCGKPATQEAQGWFMSVCDDCYKEKYGPTEPIEFKTYYNIERYNENEGTVTEKVDFSEEWNRYLDLINNEKREI